MTQLLSIFMIWICAVHMPITNAEWTLSNQPLPVADEESAVGAYDGSIFILGGYYNQKQLTEYVIATDTLIDHGTTGLNQDMTDGARETQFWTQVDHILYILDSSNPYFDTYDMITNTFTTNWNGITLPAEVEDRGCLSSSSEYLYVIGGRSSDDILNELQVLALSSQQWLINPPKMSQERLEHACIAHNDYLWVFGGDDGSDELKNNERISIINIIQNTWNYIEDLSEPVYLFRAVAMHDTIYLIGGRDTTYAKRDFVHLVDAITGSVTVSSDYLPLVNAWSAPIIVDAMLYVFGGFWDNNKRTDDWAYYPLPTSNPASSPKDPTTSPTKRPTMLPSNPTGQPTLNPPLSNDPSSLPSTNPTLNPSSNPTLNPSSNPTLNPSIHPSNEPSSLPPINPTLNPSSNPTLNPSSNPTLNPSSNPTLNPSSNPTSAVTLEETIAETKGENGREVEDVTITETEDEHSDTIRENNKIFSDLVSVIIAVTVTLILGGAIGGIYILHKHSGNKIQNRIEQQIVELTIPDGAVDDVKSNGIIDDNTDAVDDDVDDSELMYGAGPPDLDELRTAYTAGEGSEGEINNDNMDNALAEAEGHGREKRMTGIGHGTNGGTKGGTIY